MFNKDLQIIDNLAIMAKEKEDEEKPTTEKVETETDGGSNE